MMSKYPNNYCPDLRRCRFDYLNCDIKRRSMCQIRDSCYEAYRKRLLSRSENQLKGGDK